jgi:hypothetical protein
MENKKLQEAIASLMKDGKREALAQLITEYVQPNHITTDIVGMLLDTRALNPGDALVRKLRKGLKVRTLVPGSIHLASEITVSERVNYVLDGADIKVTANEWDLANGDIGTVESIRSEMLAKLKDFYLNKVFTALTTVWNGSNTPYNYAEVSSKVTYPVLEAAIDRINQTTTGVKVVVGTRKAMTPITKFAAFWTDGASHFGNDPTTLQEIMQNGYVGKYYGADLLSLDQVYDNPEDNNALLPDNYILVIGEHAGEFITYGNVIPKEWTDMRPTPPQWFLELYQQFGMIIDNAQGIYMIKIV